MYSIRKTYKRIPSAFYEDQKRRQSQKNRDVRSRPPSHSPTVRRHLSSAAASNRTVSRGSPRHSAKRTSGSRKRHSIEVDLTSRLNAKKSSQDAMSSERESFSKDNGTTTIPSPELLMLMDASSPDRGVRNQTN